MKDPTKKTRKRAERRATPTPRTSPDRALLLAECALVPELRHAAISRAFGNALIADDDSEMKDTVEVLTKQTAKTAKGDLRVASRMLTAQALTLDAIFTQMAYRASLNFGEYFDAAERYMRLALKAQANSRATLEALVRLHQPREQIVKHVTVQDGGQAVVAENFHHHRTGGQNENSEHQPHVCEPALLGENTGRDTLSVSSNEGKEKVPASRRKGDGRP